MRYGHFKKFPRTDELRAALSRKERNWVNRWLDSPKGKKLTLPLQGEAVKNLAEWEKKHGFDGPMASTTDVPKELEYELKKLMWALDDVALKQLKKAIAELRKEERKIEAKKLAAEAKRTEQA